MSEEFPDFTDLIAPLPIEDFLGEYWEKEIFHSAEPITRLNFGLHDVDAYLARSDLRLPAIRMVKDGKNIAPQLYTSELNLGSHKSRDLIDTDKVLRLFDQGSTILFQMAQTSFPPLTRWCAALEAFWGFPIEMNVYLTPPNSRGFTAHYDTHSVFALQVCGSKHWQFYEGSVDLPFLDEPYSESYAAHSVPRREILNIELQPNAFLYVPRGHFHSARSSEHASLHVTVGLFPPTRWNLVSRWVESLRNDRFFREASFRYLKPARDQDRLDVESKLLTDALIQHLTMNLEALSIQRSSTKEVQPKESRLLDLTRLDRVNPHTVMKRRGDLKTTLGETQGKITLTLFDTKVMFPKHAKEALVDIFAKSGEFTPADVHGDLSDEGKTTLCKRLIKEGVLTIARF